MKGPLRSLPARLPWRRPSTRFVARASAACSSTAARSSFDDVDAKVMREEAGAAGRRRSNAAGRRGRAKAAHRFDRDGISRRWRRRMGAADGAGRRRRSHAPVLRAVRVPRLRHRLRGSATAPVLVQQPVRRVSHLPRFRQHRRARHGSGRAGSIQVDHPERHRAVEQAALPHATCRAEASGEEGEAAARRAVVGADTKPRSSSSSKGTTTSTAFAGSSGGSRRRSTRCTSACS